MKLMHEAGLVGKALDQPRLKAEPLQGNDFDPLSIGSPMEIQHGGKELASGSDNLLEPMKRSSHQPLAALARRSNRG